jgi:hypothetical protein
LEKIIAEGDFKLHEPPKGGTPNFDGRLKAELEASRPSGLQPLQGEAGDFA